MPPTPSSTPGMLAEGGTGTAEMTVEDGVAVVCVGWALKEVGTRFTRWRRRFCLVRTATEEEMAAADGTTHFLLVYKSDANLATARPVAALPIFRDRTTAVETFKRVICASVQNFDSADVLRSAMRLTLNSRRAPEPPKDVTEAKIVQHWIQLMGSLEPPINASELRRNTLGTGRVAAVRPTDEVDTVSDESSEVLTEGVEGGDIAATPEPEVALGATESPATEVPVELQPWAVEFHEAYLVWQGQVTPVSWGAVLKGIIRLIEMMTAVRSVVVKNALFRTVAHCDSFFSGRLDPSVYGNEFAERKIDVGPGRMDSGQRRERCGGEISADDFFEQLRSAAASPLLNLPAELHSYAQAHGFNKPFDGLLVPDQPLNLTYDQYHLDGRPAKVDSQGFLLEEATNPDYRVKFGVTQASYVAYLRPEFDSVTQHLLKDPAWTEKLGSSDPLRVLLAMVAIHSEYVDATITKLYPAGLGHEHGSPMNPSPKGLDRMRVKATGDYSGIGVAPSRSGESWRKLHILGPAKRCKGAIGEPLYDHAPSDDVLYSRAATAVGCLLDTVRRSLTTKTTEAQEVFLKSLLLDASRWRVLRIKSTLQDDQATVKQCLVNVVFNAPSEQATSANVNGECQTYAEMTNSAMFEEAVQRVRERNTVGDGVLDAACELFRSPQIASEPITLVVELQMYVDYFLEQRKRVHAFYKLLRADTPLALTADCAKYGVEGSTLGCSTDMLQHRAVVITRILGGESCYLFDEWALDGLQSAHSGDLAAVLAVTRTLRRLDLDMAGEPIGVVGAKLLGPALAVNSGLLDLDLAHNEVGDVGAAALAGGLQRNEVLTTLRLSTNKIGSVGAEALAEWLGVSTTLETLDLTSNEIAEAGGAALSLALAKNSSLRCLNLSRNVLRDEGVRELAKGLAQNCGLKALFLTGNLCADEGAMTLAQTLETNTTLEDLRLDVNGILSAGGKALARALTSTRSLKSINLKINFKIDQQARSDLLEAAGSSGVTLVI